MSRIHRGSYGAIYSNRPGAASAAIAPGVDFGTNAPERHVRFAYTNPVERLREGVARIAKFLNRE